MRNIRVGFLNFLKKDLISTVTLDNNFLTPLARYINVIIIPVDKMENVKQVFGKIEKHKLDYLYIDGSNLFLEFFLLREKFQLDIPFIFNLHVVYLWVFGLTFIIPLIRKYDIILSPSQYAKESFFRISDKFNVHIIPHFLDMNFIQNNISHNFKNDKKTITFMGRLVEEKGIKTLIKCMPRIIAKVRNAHLNIIGPLSGEGIKDHPKSAYVKKLEKITRKLKLTNRVHFKGVQLGLDKYKILSRSDIFVNPTLALVENFPVVNFDALACGVPVITTKWAGNKEIIINGKNGFLVDVKYDKNKKPGINIKQLVSLIVKVLKDTNLNLKMKRNSLKTALRYDYRKVLPRLIGLLKKKPPLNVKSKWSLIKNKRVIDFRHLFNEKFFFFIYCSKKYRKEIYSSLYKKVIDLTPPKKSSHPNIRKRINKEKDKNTKRFKKLGQDFSDFLLLRGK